MTPTGTWQARDRLVARRLYVNAFTQDPAMPTARSLAVAEAVGRVFYEMDRLLAALLTDGTVPHTISYWAARAAREGDAWGLALCGLLHAIDPGHCERVLAQETPHVPL
jgi:hypothetical protein